ncbi:cox19-like CHCH family protein [Wolffia australiana]
MESSESTSMEALLAEAAAFSTDDNESVEEKVKKALECPCVAGLRAGPCGVQFSDAFACFLRSTSEEKGSDCVNPFIALQDCVKAYPNAFSKDLLGSEESKKEDDVVSASFRIIPPSWSRKSKNRS